MTHRLLYGEKVHAEEIRNPDLSGALSEAALRVAVLEQEHATVRVHVAWDSEVDETQILLFVSLKPE
jgi:hypothetical protein